MSSIINKLKRNILYTTHISSLLSERSVIDINYHNLKNRLLELRYTRNNTSFNFFSTLYYYF